jgi:hypothetical protein
MNDYKKRLSIKDDLLQSLENSYAILKGVLESSQNIVIFALDCRYRYLAFNQSHHQTMKQIWGVDIALGNSMLDYIKNSDDRLKAKKNFDRALSGESFTLEEEYGIVMKRRYYENIYNPIIDKKDNIIGLTLFLTDITDRKRTEAERDRLISELQVTLAKVKVLSGLIPVCSNCKKIRDDKGYWNRLESYIEKHSDATFSHGMCPDCSDEIYSKEDWYIKMKNEQENK